MRTYIAAIIRWLAALPASRFGDLGVAAEAMWKLNVLARRRDTDHNMRDWIYDLKNRFIRLLYEEGYCVQAGKTRQVQECWGTWQYGCDEYCPKCGGTGIYREHGLYDFVFVVDGVRYAWHQPERMVDWPVELTRQEVEEYEAAPDRPEEVTGEHVKLLSLIVWWSLALRRRAPKLPLLNPFRIMYVNMDDYYGSPKRLYIPFVQFNWDDRAWRMTWPAIPEWQVGKIMNTYRDLGWIKVSFGRGSERGHWYIDVLGLHLEGLLWQLRNRIACFLHGHDDYRHHDHISCARCYRTIDDGD